MKNILLSSKTIHLQNKCLNRNATSVKLVEVLGLVKTHCRFVNATNTEVNYKTSLS